MQPALLAIVNNIAPYVKDLQRATSSMLLNIFVSMSSPSFLLANESNHVLLFSLLDAINALLDHQQEGESTLSLLSGHEQSFVPRLWNRISRLAHAVFVADSIMQRIDALLMLSSRLASDSRRSGTSPSTERWRNSIA